jgi:hypothetical protein
MNRLETYSEGTPHMTYESVAALRNDFDSRFKAIQNNDELPERARHRKLAQLKEEMQGKLEETLKAIEQREEAELRSAWKDANPKSKVPDMTPAQALYRREILDEIQSIADSLDTDTPGSKTAIGDALLEMYAKAWHQEDAKTMDAIAQRGRKHMDPEQAKELQGLEDHRNSGLATLRKEYERIKAQQGSDGTGRALQVGTLRNSLQLTPEESNALAQSKAGQQPVPAGSIQSEGSES